MKGGEKMAEQINVYVNNALREDIHLLRKLSNGKSDLAATIGRGNKKKIFLSGPGKSLVIYAPAGMDTKECPLNVRSDVNLAVLCSRTDSTWAIQIEPGDLSPGEPKAVNVTIGGM
jgi:hypothetical protein